MAQRLRQARLARSFVVHLCLLFLALVALIIFCITFSTQNLVEGLGLLLLKGGLKQIVSPSAGTIESIAKEEGELVHRGDVVAWLRDEPGDNKTPIVAYTQGIIAEVVAYPDTVVQKGQPTMFLTNVGDVTRDLELIGFVSSLEGKKIAPGMKAFIDPSIVSARETGHLLATVKRVGKLPMSKAAIMSVIKIPEIAHYMRSQIEAEPFVVVLSLNPDQQHETGYAWTGPGPHFLLDSGIIASVAIITEEVSLLQRLWPSLFRVRDRGW